MSRSVLIVGNGLGLSLDPEYFKLSKALEKVWADESLLSAEDKRMISSAIEKVDVAHPPETEEQLDQIQIALIATEFLLKFKVSGVSWVSDSASKLPVVFKKFIHKVALYFGQTNYSLPKDFIIPLSQFISETKSHVVTLNYDNLLYDALQKEKILDGYNGSLIDGFWKSGFSNENLDRHNVARHGWFMHLHGSPLFIDTRKVMRSERNEIEATERSHIVLCHVEHKPFIILSSNILTAYWQRLSDALDESKRIILFGYSGLDKHLNELIRTRYQKDGKKLFIIEWSGAGKREQRLKFWSEKIGVKCQEITLIQKDNILEFKEWNINLL